MNNSIGDAVKEEISEIVTLYNKAVREHQNVKDEYAVKKIRMRYLCDNLGDEFLKRMVTRMVNAIASKVKKN